MARDTRFRGTGGRFGTISDRPYQRLVHEKLLIASHFRRDPLHTVGPSIIVYFINYELHLADSNWAVRLDAR